MVSVGNPDYGIVVERSQDDEKAGLVDVREELQGIGAIATAQNMGGGVLSTCDQSFRQGVYNRRDSS